MTGKSGMTGKGLGGKRPGSGRPISRFALRRGDELLVSYDGLPAKLYTVADVTRAKLTLTSDDGQIVVKIFR